jgi:hypothetical protein
MIKAMATVFGIIFLLAGVLGFVPGITHDGHLLGIFHVNTAHNIVHLLSGLAALVAASMGVGPVQNYFRIFGIVYGLVALLGFLNGDQPVFGIIANNTADTWLHVAIALVSLMLGFAPNFLGQRRAAVAGPEL